MHWFTSNVKEFIQKVYAANFFYLIILLNGLHWLGDFDIVRIFSIQ